MQSIYVPLTVMYTLGADSYNSSEIQRWQQEMLLSKSAGEALLISIRGIRLNFSLMK